MILHSFLDRIHKYDIEKIDLINRERTIVLPILIANFNFRGRAYDWTTDSARGIYINQ